MRITPVFIAAVSVLGAWDIEAQPRYVRTALIADTEAVEAAKPFRLGILFTIPPCAHIYWRHPGDSGLPTSIEWRLPEGFEAGELQWPNPVRFEIPKIDDISYGYGEETLLFIVVTPTKTADITGALTVEAEAQWLICFEDGECIPERAELRLSLPAGPARPSGHVTTFETHAARVPISAGDPSIASMVELRAKEGRLSAIAKGPWRFTSVASGPQPDFFPEDGPSWELIERGGETWPNLEFAAPRGDGGAATPAGVLTLPVQHAETGEARVLYIRLGVHDIEDHVSAK